MYMRWINSHISSCGICANKCYQFNFWNRNELNTYPDSLQTNSELHLRDRNVYEWTLELSVDYESFWQTTYSALGNQTWCLCVMINDDNCFRVRIFEWNLHWGDEAAMSSTCETCGSTSFNLVDGFFFCDMCGTRSEVCDLDLIP